MDRIVSFGLCPFVQRSIITLNLKNAPYEVKYIDLANKPDWFLEISPLGKVPVLQTDQGTLFESAVINEYVDEIHGESLHHKDPFVKARERAYIELSSTVTFDFFQTIIATNKEAYESNKLAFEKNLTSLLEEFKGPFFRGEKFSLVDSSAIPVLHRLNVIEKLKNKIKLSDENLKKLAGWSEVSLNLEAVKKSVPENFEQDFRDYVDNKDGYLLSLKD